MAERAWAIVTGGNRGLGYEVCRKLVAAGHPVVLTARDTAAGEKAAAELKAGAPGGAAQVEVARLDAASADSIKALAAEIGAKYGGKIDLLVNNAGVIHGGWTPQGHAATIATNTDGPLDLSLALLPHLARGARVVMVASALGKLGMVTPDYAGPISSATTLDAVRAAARAFHPDSEQAKGFSPSYSVSKAALIRATQLLAADPAFTSKAVSVVSVCPGWCATDMGNSATEKIKTPPPRTAEQGAASIMMAADADVAANGSFTYDGEAQDWAGTYNTDVPPQPDK